MNIAALHSVIDRIEREAFNIPPPNVHTPHIVQLCLLARRLLNDEGTRQVQPKLIVED